MLAAPAPSAAAAAAAALASIPFLSLLKPSGCSITATPLLLSACSAVHSSSCAGRWSWWRRCAGGDAAVHLPKHMTCTAQGRSCMHAMLLLACSAEASCCLLQLLLYQHTPALLALRPSLPTPRPALQPRHPLQRAHLLRPDERVHQGAPPGCHRLWLVAFAPQRRGRCAAVHFSFRCKAAQQLVSLHTCLKLYMSFILLPQGNEMDLALSLCTAQYWVKPHT